MKTPSKGIVLYIGGFELPDKNAAAQRVLSNAKLFRDIGYQTVFLGVSKELQSNVITEATHFVYAGFSMYSLPYPKTLRQWKEYLTDAERYIKMADKLDNLKAIICYNFQSVALNKIRKYCIKSNIKCIGDVTEWYSVLGRSFPVKILKGLDTFYRMRIVHKKLDALIVISRYLQNFYQDCKNVVYIPPLSDFEDNLKEEKINKKGNTLTLIYAGSPGLKDMINLLIEGISRVKREVHLDIVGIDEKDYLLLHPEDKNKKMLASNIVFHGRLSHEETVNYVKNATFSCFFRYEDRVTKAGFPTKFSEAISLGTPVITNRSSNVHEYIHNGVNGILIDELSVDAITQAIENADISIIVDKKTFNYRNYYGEACQLLGNI